MKVLLKNLGLLLIVIGAVLLIASALTGSIKDNVVLTTSAILIVVGLISYIIINKKITD